MKLVKLFNIFITLVVLVNRAEESESGNILAVIPHTGYSHFRVFQPILLGLLNRNHNLTVVSYFKLPVSGKYENLREIILIGNEPGTDVLDISGFEPSRSWQEMYNEFWALAYEGNEACEIFYKSNAVREILEIHRRNPFDLILVEFFNTDCFLGLVPILSIPFIGLSSCALMPWHYDRVGLPDFPSFIPNEFVESSEYMSFWERFTNFIVIKGTKFLYRQTVEAYDNEIIKKYLNINVDVHEIAKNTSIIFVNQHYTLSGARPLSSQIIEIGGVHVNARDTSLSEELKTFLDASQNGIILISWGSMVKGSTISHEKIKGIINALNRLPQEIIWKWESDQLPVENKKKYYFQSWIPQKDILCHPNVKMFWSHGGLLGVSESVYCGKPLLVTPYYGDQFLNGKAVENRKIGKMLHYEDINEKTVFDHLQKLLSENYTKSAKHLSERYRHRPMTPLNTSIWWIENVLEARGNILTYSPNVEMNWFHYYSLDVITILLIGFCNTALLVAYFCWRLCFCGICYSGKRTTSTSQLNKRGSRKIKAS